MRQASGSAVGRVLLGLSCGLLLTAVSACTGSAGPAAPQPSRRPLLPAQPTGTPVTLQPRPAPLRVRITRVHGRLAKHSRKTLAHTAGHTVSTYFQQAFLGGQYPRDDLGNAFASFSPGAAAKARRDRDLLTNAGLPADTVAVVARRQTAHLSVLAPYKVAAGVTADVHLTFLVERAQAPDRMVTVKGRLLLTRRRSGGWQIFGYHLTRSAVPAKAADR